MSDPVRVLVVDDEPAARRRLQRLLEGRSNVELVGEAGNGREAARLIEQLRPDLVFLDIQMPDEDGFWVLESIGPAIVPVVVFVTAFDEYAVGAFEVCALDYLLKPFEDERFEATWIRAVEALRQKRSSALDERLSCVVEGHRRHDPGAVSPGESSPALSGSAGSTRNRIAVHRGNHVFLVPVADVDWIEAQGVYVGLHVGERCYLVRESLTHLVRTLNPARFARIHRSTVVQIDRVRELRPLFRGEYAVLLRDGTELKLSRSYRNELERLRT